MKKKTPEPTVNKSNMVQHVVLTLSDGTKHTFTGQVAIDPNDARQCKLKVKDIAFTVPKPMADGCSWERIG